jgi:hypothetical protein
MRRRRLTSGERNRALLSHAMDPELQLFVEDAQSTPAKACRAFRRSRRL